jgi:biotin carboxyl carrier protein
VVEPLGNGRYLVSGTRSSDQVVAYAATEGGPSTSLGAGRTWVFIAGRTYVIEAQDRDGRSRVRRSDDHLALSAPMPATVLAVKVAAGQAVEEGDVLITLEAMKMELPIKAPRAGTIKSIACREGELVQSGVPLLELE